MSVKVSKQSSNSDNVVYFNATIKSGKHAILLDDISDLHGESLKNFAEGLRIDFEDLPDFPVIPHEQPKFNFRVAVIWDAEKQSVIALNPWSGVYEAIGIDVGPRPEEGGDPISKVTEKVGQDQKPYIDKSFYVIFKIIEKNEANGFFDGTTPRMFLKDKFFMRPDGMTDVSGTSKSKHTLRVSEFGEMTGVFDDDIQFPEDGNVLPIILERLIEISRPVRLTFKNGFVDSLLPSNKSFISNLEKEEPFLDDEKDEPVRRPKTSEEDVEL